MNKKKNNKRVIIASVCCIVALIILAIVLLYFFYSKISFYQDDGSSISNGSSIEVAHGSSELPSIKAVYSDWRDNKGGVELETKQEGEADLSQIGEYKIKYSAEYNSKSKEIEVTIKVVDKTGPEITLKGGPETTWALGEAFVDPGYSAVDNVDGDVTDNVTVEGNVDYNTEGEYTLTYKVKDAANNETVITRKVTVAEKKQDVTSPNDKVVYLTFDDGPGPYTSQLLDILDKYGVKVTFFVTHGYPKYENLIGEEARRGHTVAIHSYTHKYEQIYVSTDAFFSDLNAMKDVIVNQTGQAPKLIRFPGGASNQISARYCKGIMTTLTKAVENQGYRYCDWNVSSGDAGQTTSTDQVVNNVISGMQSHNVSWVLQHDIKDFSVNAVERIIQWGQANGYRFLPITDSSEVTHHPVNN